MLTHLDFLPSQIKALLHMGFLSTSCPFFVGSFYSNRCSAIGHEGAPSDTFSDPGKGNLLMDMRPTVDKAVQKSANNSGINYHYHGMAQPNWIFVHQQVG